MLAKNAKFLKDKKKPLVCSHCDAPGHTIYRFFQIIGYPLGWKGPRGPRSGNAAKPDSTVNVLVKNNSSEYVVASYPLFTQEMFEQFLNFAKLQKGTDNAHTVAGAFVEVLPQEPGIHVCFNTIFSKSCVWIFYTGLHVT